MHKYWKQIAAGSLAVMLATPVPIQAAIKKSIYVGDVVSITAADLKVNKGYKSLSELNTISIFSISIVEILVFKLKPGFWVRFPPPP